MLEAASDDTEAWSLLQTTLKELKDALSLIEEKAKRQLKSDEERKLGPVEDRERILAQLQADKQERKSA